MALKLHAPRKGWSKNWRIRGTYLGEYIDASCRTPDRAKARKILAALKGEIERRALDPAPVNQNESGPGFAEAALDYLDAGGSAGGLGRFDPQTGTFSAGLIAHFADTPIGKIDQRAIDKAALALYPQATPATRNRWVYTPVSAILKHAGIDRRIRRPKGWRGSARVDWMQPDLAFRMLAAAERKDREFAAFLTVLLYTGMRLSEALGLSWERVSLAESFCYLPETKNAAPRLVHLPPAAVAALANHPRGTGRNGERVFRFRKCGRLYTWLGEVRRAAGPDADFVTFHSFRHTWATWMRRYGGLDTSGLVATGAWRDHASARRYEHVVASEEARRADALPVPEKTKGRENG